MRYVLTRNSEISKKKRRHSGRRTGRSTIKMPRKWIIDNCLEPHEFWDDWTDHRDGFREYSDRTKITKNLYSYNCGMLWCNRDIFSKKCKRLAKRRKLRKRRVA